MRTTICCLFLIATSATTACMQGITGPPNRGGASRGGETTFSDQWLPAPTRARKAAPKIVPKPAPEPQYLDILRDRAVSHPADKLGDFAAWYDHRLANEEASEHERIGNEYAAVQDILVGDYEGAIKRLHAIESSYPGFYDTAATLGTAYELAGDNRNALRWISTGVERNPKSHYGTEWLHVRILEAKIALEKDPGYLVKNPIIAFPATDGASPESGLSYDSRKISRGEVADALQFQLGERMLFVKPEDPVVADLLHSYADLKVKGNSGGHENVLMDMAYSYGYDEKAIEDSRKWDETKNTWLAAGVWAGIFGIVLFLKLRAG